MRLGEIYRDGQIVAQDGAKAVTLFQAAADAGNAGGQINIAQMLIKGQGVPADIAKGLSLLQTVAATGNSGALYTLGDLYSRGGPVAIDAAKAIDYLTKSVVAGNAGANVRLGEIYRDGQILKSDMKISTAYFRKASEAGLTDGALAIARGHLAKTLGPQSDPELGWTILKQLKQQGVPQASMLEAQSYFNGWGIKPDPRKAIKVLLTASGNGNISASRELISVYRDGRGKEIPKKPELALKILEKVSKQLDVGTVQHERALIFASANRDSKSYPKILEYVEQVPLPLRLSTFMTLRNVNLNAFVYSLQSVMKQNGFYKGELDGLLAKSTLRSIASFCDKYAAGIDCKKGPLNQLGAESLTQIMFLSPRLRTH